MRSGMGQMIKPDKAIIMKAISMVDADFNPAEMKKENMKYGDGDHVVVPRGVAPLATIYKSGDPHYITKFNAPDFATQR